MNAVPDKVAVQLTSLIALDEEWYALVSATTIPEAQETTWVRDLRIEPQVVLDAAEVIRANQDAFDQIRGLLLSECDCPPCFFSLSPVFVEMLRLYYLLRAPKPST